MHDLPLIGQPEVNLLLSCNVTSLRLKVKPTWRHFHIDPYSGLICCSPTVSLERSCRRHPCCRASIRTLSGPLVGPVHVGVRSKPRIHHDHDGPGIVGAAIYRAVSWTSTQNAVTRTRRWMSCLSNVTGKSWILAPSTPVCFKSAFSN